jgi:hypothetical protein
MKLDSSGEADVRSVSQTYFEFLGFVKENSHFERRAVADSSTSQMSFAARPAGLLFSVKMGKLFAMPARSYFLVRMGTLGGTMIN